MFKLSKILILLTAFILSVIPALTCAESAAAGDCGITVLAFLDAHMNGEKTESENGVPNVEVSILDQNGGEVASGKTDANGLISFSKLSPGRYTIHAVTPVDIGYSQKGKQTGLKFGCIGMRMEREADSDPIELKPGETAERGLALMQLVHLSGFCWMDTNGNGIREDGEPMVSGVKITADGQKNGLHYETVSDVNGNWVINQVKPGFYTLSAYSPEGMMFTRYSRTGGNNRSIFTAEGKTKASKTVDTNDNESKENLNIGFMKPTVVSGLCFLDANYNGVYDEGEKPLAGVKVTAIKQIKDEVAANSTSGKDGKYALNALRSNTFKIKATLPADGSVYTRVSSEETGNKFSAHTGRRESTISDYVLEDGQQRELNIGAVYPATVSGTAYLDNDFSGTLTGKEKTVSGLDVTLLGENGEAINKVKTNAKGVYKFENVMPGTYSLQLTAMPGYAFTRSDHGSVIQNRQNGEGYSEPFEVKIGENITGQDIGMIKPATVKGRIFADDNDNGVQDEEEKGFTDAEVKLIGKEGEAFSCKPDENGDFIFDAVMPGTYRVMYELPEHSIFAQVAAGGNTVSAQGQTGASEEFQINSGDMHEVSLCGALKLANISGKAFSDHEATGKADADSEGLAGVKITMTPKRSGLKAVEAVTKADGEFALEDLHPGDYTLSVAMPDGLVVSRTGALELPLRPGLSEQEHDITVSAGQNVREQGIGGVEPASLSGQVWLDENNNGRQDRGEATPAGMSIEIWDDTANTSYGTMKTDENGGFSSDGMIPGRYTLSMKLDADMDEAEPGESDFKRDGNLLTLSGLKIGEGDDKEGLKLGYIRYVTISGKVIADEAGEMKPLAGAKVTLIPAADYESGSGDSATDAGGSDSFESKTSGSESGGVEISAGSESGDASGSGDGATDAGGSDNSGSEDSGSERSKFNVNIQGSKRPYTVTTGENGMFSFSGLLPEKYILKANLPKGYLLAEPDDERLASGSMSSVITRDIDGRDGRSEPITVRMTENYDNCNVAAVLPGRLGDFCWLDENGNGLQDSDEPGIPGVKIRLMRKGKVIAETVSDQYGFYRFNEVYPAVYTLGVTMPAEVMPTKEVTDYSNIVSILHSANGTEAETSEIAILSNTANYNADLGFVLIEAGRLPKGLGEGKTQNWTRIIVETEQK